MATKKSKLYLQNPSTKSHIFIPEALIQDYINELTLDMRNEGCMM